MNKDKQKSQLNPYLNNSMNRKLGPFRRFIPLFILLFSLLCVFVFVVSEKKHDQLLKERIDQENDIQISNKISNLQHYFDGMYQLLNYISRLPEVIALDKSCKRIVQTLYDQEWESSIRFSEIYIIKDDFDGTQAPFMTFEYSVLEEVEDVHSLEREADEYAVQMEQIQRFKREPNLLGLFSDEIPLCTENLSEDGRAMGYVYSVPIRSNGKLIGIVAGMIPTIFIQHQLNDKLNYIEFILLCPQGKIISSSNLFEEERFFLEKEFMYLFKQTSSPSSLPPIEGWNLFYDHVKLASNLNLSLAYKNPNFFLYDAHKSKETLYFITTLTAIIIIGISLALLHLSIVKKYHSQTLYLTEKKKNEVILQNDRDRMYSLLNKIPGFICLISKESQIKFTNTFFAQKFNQEDEKICNQLILQKKSSCEKCKDNSYNCNFCQTFQFLEDGRNDCFEQRMSDGKTYEIYTYPFQDIDGTLLAMILGIDITMRKKLQYEIVNICNEEKQRLGRDIHDGVGQQMTGITFLCKTLSMQLEKKGLSEADEAKRLTELINNLLFDIRNLVRGLEITQISKHGLVNALEKLSKETFRNHEITCTFQCDDLPVFEDRDIESHLFRIAQEAVNNAIKHSGCKSIAIRLDVSINNGILTITDDGTGLKDFELIEDKFSFRTMRYRASIIGGKFEILNNHGCGVSIICTFPCKKSKNLQKCKVL